MRYLKKNDKIIIIAAVVILLFAGIGIAMYQSPTPKDIHSIIGTEKTYTVTWVEKQGSLNTISEFADKNAGYEGIVIIPHGNLKSITFNLTWKDDHMTMFKRMGLDTLTLEVMTPDERTFTESQTSAPKTGQGMINRTITVGIIPPAAPIIAQDEQAAQAKLKTQPYFDDSWTNKDITVKVGVQIGEMRLLKKLRDKGNDFELKITYLYYDGIINEDTTKNSGLGNTTPPEDPWMNQQIPPYISMIINTGCGRFV